MNKLVLITLFSLIIALNSLRTTWNKLDKSYTFEDYKREYGKSYDSESEQTSRKAIFESKLATILHHNKNPHLSWKMGINHLTDYSDAELKSLRGLRKDLVYRSHSLRGEKSPVIPGPIDFTAIRDLPKQVDWREKGVVTPVKDQGRCGSCWSFASATTIESMFAINSGQLVELSEQNILDCTPNPHHCGGTGGCGGGTAELAYDMIKNNGIASEWTYPYISYNGADFQCNRKQPYTTISGYVQLPSNQYLPLLTAVANIGPIAISVDASAWSYYESGVFDGCNQTNPDIDHNVQLVGYGTDNMFGDYWLVRNSWSPLFGENGYIRLRRETTPRCGIDIKPGDGSGCDNGPPTVTVCGTCGILYDSVYPLP